MKWEPRGPATHWCECRVATSPSLALVLKGIIFQPPDTPWPFADVDILDRWVDAMSPNAPSVLQSMLPTITDKALLYAFHDMHKQIDLASIVKGCAVIGV